MLKKKRFMSYRLYFSELYTMNYYYHYEILKISQFNSQGLKGKHVVFNLSYNVA